MQIRYFCQYFLCLTAHKAKAAAYPYVEEQRRFSELRPVPSSQVTEEQNGHKLDFVSLILVSREKYSCVVQVARVFCVG